MLHPELMLAAMVDMLFNILIFLLHLYGTAPIDSSNPDLDLPESEATDPVEAAPIVVLTTGAVEVAGEPLVPFTSNLGMLGDPAADPTEGGAFGYPEGSVQEGRLPPLVEWLTARRATMLERDPEAEADTIIVECDRRVPWSLVSPVLASAGSVGFTNFRFVVNTVTADSSAD